MHKNVLAETIRINIHIMIFFLCDLDKGYQEEWKRELFLATGQSTNLVHDSAVVYLELSPVVVAG